MSRLIDQPRWPGPPNNPDDPNDPFRLGWRHVHVLGPDGTEEVKLVPLTEEDVLYPEEEDYVVQKPPHLRDFVYLLLCLRTLYAGRHDIVVLGDCRVDWNHATIRPLGPDILVIFDVIEWQQQGTYRFAVEGGHPELVIEVTSPSTHRNDVGPKADLYHQLNIPLYALLDRGRNGDEPLRVHVFAWAPAGWQELAANAQGRIDLAPIPLWLGVEDDRPRLYHANGRVLPDPENLGTVLAEVEQRWAQEIQAREQAEEQARQAEEQARQAEEQARQEAQARLQAEAQARQAEEQARQEAQARLQAEAQIRLEVQARQQAEAQARQAEEQARRAEEQARRAEEQARQEAQARADLEAQLRALQDLVRHRDNPP